MKRTPLKRSMKRLRRRKPFNKRSVKRSGVEYKDTKWREAVRVHFGDECRFNWRGGCRGAIETHHVFGKKAYPHLRHLAINGARLCCLHHRMIHDNPRLMNLLLADLCEETRTELERLAKLPR